MTRRLRRDELEAELEAYRRENARLVAERDMLRAALRMMGAASGAPGIGGAPVIPAVE